MATTAAPYGLKPLKLLGSQGFAGAVREFKMTTNSATAIFNGDLVNISSGQPAAVGTTPTTTKDGNTPVGVMVGVRATDPVNKQELHMQYLPANAVTNGWTNIYLKVIDDPDCLFQVQADGTVPLTSMGLNAPLSFTAGSTVTGNSKVAVIAASAATTNTLAVRIVGFIDSPGFSAVGDTYTDLIVKFNQGVHAYQNATGG